jgi:Tfp pilus assembly protein PilF
MQAGVLMDNGTLVSYNDIRKQRKKNNFVCPSPRMGTPKKARVALYTFSSLSSFSSLLLHLRIQWVLGLGNQGNRQQYERRLNKKNPKKASWQVQ